MHELMNFQININYAIVQTGFNGTAFIY